jgi:ABC-type dipeptide/oligopeptide/nickel transport system permease subunit
VQGIGVRPAGVAIVGLDRSAGQRARQALRSLWRRGGLRALLCVAAVAPVLAPYDPLETDLTNLLRGPSAYHLLGTDPVGRDVFSRILIGSRLALAVGLVSVSASLAIGLVLGAAAGYAGRWVDAVVMMLTDALLALPLLVVALAIVAALGPSLTNIMLAIGVGSSPGILRVVRGQVLAARVMPYTEAARVVGAGHLRVLIRHILPNIIAPLIVLGSLRMATAILAEASLSFLGLGVRPPEPSWGSMANFGRAYFAQAPWLTFAPVAAIFLVVLAWNFFGDGLRDYLDPRLRR